MTNDKSWNDDLRRRFSDYCEDAPQTWLDNAKAEMMRRGITMSDCKPHATRTPGMFAHRLAAAAAVLLLLAGAALWNWLPRQGRDVRRTTAALSPAQLAHKTPPTLAEVPSRMIDYKEPQLLASADGTTRQYRHPIPTATTPEAGTEPVPAARQTETEEKTADAAAPGQADATQRQPGTDKHQDLTAIAPIPAHRPHRRTYNAATDKQRNDHTQAPVSLAMAYSGAISDQRSGDIQLPMFAHSVNAMLYGASDEGEAPATQHESHHQRPIKVGLQVSIPLSRQWSLRTGVDYSYMRSTFNSVSSLSHAHTSQRLHYVGIPVSVACDIWKNKLLDVYATAGGEAERLVKGRATTTHSDNAVNAEEERQVVKSPRPVFSVTGAAGIAVKLGGVVSVYAEPGVNYHFKNGDHIESFYTDKPLQFSMSLGVRILTGNP